MLVVSGIKRNGGNLGLQGLKSLWENCKIRTSAAKAGLILQIFVVAKATTHKDSQVLTHTLKPLLLIPLFGWAKAQSYKPNAFWRADLRPANRVPLTNQRQIPRQVKLTYALAADKEGSSEVRAGGLAR